MQTTLYALTGFTAWTLLLIFIVFNVRGFYALLASKKIAVNKFSPDGSDLPGFPQRVTRAHLNAVENLVVFAALVLVAALSDRYAVMEGTVMFVLYARIAQSTVHMISTSVLAVWLRATFWGVQLALFIWYAIQLLG